MDMKQLLTRLEVAPDAAPKEVEEAYLRKRARYEQEVRGTSAKPRLRLLDEKIKQLDQAFQSFVAVEERTAGPAPTARLDPLPAAEASAPCVEDVPPPSPPVAQATKKKGGNEGRLYPLVAMDGKLVDEETHAKVIYQVDGEPIQLAGDYFLDVSAGKRWFKVTHPACEPWQKEVVVKPDEQRPVSINLSLCTSRLKLVVHPETNHRLFWEDRELRQARDGSFLLPPAEELTLTVQTEAYENPVFQLRVDPGETVSREIFLVPLKGYASIGIAQFPFTAVNKVDNRRVRFLGSDYLICGRGSAADVKLSVDGRGNSAFEELLISREHFSINRVGDAVHIKDLSSNGTYVNGSRIKRSFKIKPGEQLELGVYNPANKKFLIRKKMILWNHPPLDCAGGSRENASIPMALHLSDDSPDSDECLIAFSPFCEARMESAGRAEWMDAVLRILAFVGSGSKGKPIQQINLADWLIPDDGEENRRRKFS